MRTYLLSPAEVSLLPGSHRGQASVGRHLPLNTGETDAATFPLWMPLVASRQKKPQDRVPAVAPRGPDLGFVSGNSWTITSGSTLPSSAKDTSRLSNEQLWGWAFGVMVMMSHGPPASPSRVPGLSPSSSSYLSFLLLCTLGDSRCWLKCLGSCHPRGLLGCWLWPGSSLVIAGIWESELWVGASLSLSAF